MKAAACSCRVTTNSIFERRSDFDDIEVFFSGNPENPFHAFVLQCRHQQSSPVHGCAPLIEILMASLGRSAK